MWRRPPWHLIAIWGCTKWHLLFFPHVRVQQLYLLFRSVNVNVKSTNSNWRIHSKCILNIKYYLYLVNDFQKEIETCYFLHSCLRATFEEKNSLGPRIKYYNSIDIFYSKKIVNNVEISVNTYPHTYKKWYYVLVFVYIL